MMTYEWAVTGYSGAVRGRRPGPADLEPNCYVPCRDGAVVLVAFGETQWRALVEIMGDPSWAEDPRFATGESRTANWRELRARLAEWAKGQQGRAILEAAQSRGLPCAPCFELRDTLAGEHARETAWRTVTIPRASSFGSSVTTSARRWSVSPMNTGLTKRTRSMP